MFRKVLLVVVFVFAFAGAADVFAETVELTAFYPTPNVKYKNLNSTSTTCFATTAGNVGFGTTAPQNIVINDTDPVSGAATPNADLTITGSIHQEDWIVVGSGGTAPGFQSGWINFENAYNDAAYFRDKSGIVHLKGLVRDGANATIIFTLPTGYKPEKRELHVVATGDDPRAQAGRCDIAANGDVIAQRKSPAGVWFSLDGIKFKAKGY